MGMAPKRSPKPALIGIAILLALPFLAWLSGYLYWQVRIGRAIEDLQRHPQRYTEELFYADPELMQIGSRGLSRMLGELDQALLRGDEDLANALTCGLSDLLSGAMEVNGKAAASAGSYERTRTRQSLEEMKALLQEYRDNWAEYQQMYPPGWMWWNGRSREW